MSWDHRYRRLEMGEIIRATDEVLTDTQIGWQPVKHTVGTAAPDPNYTSHRVYRRLKDEADPQSVDWEEEDLIPFSPEPTRPSLSDTKPVRDAQRLAEVVGVMKDLDLPRAEAERLLEIEQQYTSIALPRFQNRISGQPWAETGERK